MRSSPVHVRKHAERHGVATPVACRLGVRGIVQGVGFRPFVFRLARQYGLAGHVTNTGDGVEILIEGTRSSIDAFLEFVRASPPAAARLADMTVDWTEPTNLAEFHIRDSARASQPSTVVAPDLPVCDDCLRELFDPENRRYRYPYITCTNCGPRFSLSTALPYDRQSTTMAAWPMCPDCEREYHNPLDRRFHAQAIACPHCGPHYRLVTGDVSHEREKAIDETAQLLTAGRIVGIKGVGGYHLACDASNATAVSQLRERKYRKAQAFALMVCDLETARSWATVGPEAEQLLTAEDRPVVLVPASRELPGVAPLHPRMGIMLPYAPLHHLLFAAGAPHVLVMTSGNRSSEPIAFADDDARTRLRDIADALLIGERPIARRVDDSVAQITAFGAAYIRRSRGSAPAPVARVAAKGPVLAVGGDLKNTIALLVDGNVLVSPHIGDLEHHATRAAFDRTIADFCTLYDIDSSALSVAHDAHPDYASTRLALELPARQHRAVQHHRAHVASVLAERDALTKKVVGVTFDGTGFGDDGTIWGGEFFAGSVVDGFTRVAHLHPAMLPGGDACAAFPVQAAAGFVSELGDAGVLPEDPFRFPIRYRQAVQLATARIRTFKTTSAGRLFDAVAALLGFKTPVTFEGQAAMWLEHCASAARDSATVPLEFSEDVLDWRPALRRIIELRSGGHEVSSIALAFHRGLARGIVAGAAELCDRHGVDTVVLSGGVFQNGLLMQLLHEAFAATRLIFWTNRVVPPGDGGLCLGQAAIVSSQDR
jgi:hydrogenase maturation protein HypF